jgi:hypothetical protein
MIILITDYDREEGRIMISHGINHIDDSVVVMPQIPLDFISDKKYCVGGGFWYVED